MRVRAKFNIASIELKPGNQGGVVRLQAVSRGSRNADWAAATPSGSMEMYVNNTDAFKQFLDLLVASQTPEARAAGKYPEVYIDITTAQDGWAGDGHLFIAADVAENHYLAGKCAECGYELDCGPDLVAHPNG